MTLSTTNTEQVLQAGTPRHSAQNWLLLMALVYLMLLAVSMIGSGFKFATADHAKNLFEFASNPIMGLIIGMVSTALIQSSSTVTSILVAMVAGGLPIPIAVPMIMGANIGTSITNTIVSLGHVARKDEFKRAFHAATIHDFFNVLSVLLFLPLEIATGVLEKSSEFLVSLLHMDGGLAMDGVNPVKAVTQPVVNWVTEALMFLPSVYPGVAKIAIGVLLIVLSITFMGKIMKVLMVGKAKEILHTSIGKGPISGIASGAVMTVLVQSSSTTTSLMVPLVGSGILRAKDVYPFTLGANIGTCITALIAALAITGPMGGFAMQIALVHLLFNLFSVLIIFSIPLLKNIPLRLSYGLACAASERKLYGAAYIAGLFFVVPLSVIFLSQ
ncbi:Na/Pi symporter [Aestuariibacter sp. A3R04]|uniref:Na/Pi symporter n=1 Tax=Aestuariibacter sp. A3R04 TaxID=2841571 RepID=UPI001C098000|nr:Na/Pi symporter [Aestuariibacter sp. A3R04]MBU3024024.1 Na/Pi symporter [Aestuariibacter sp. A3R04]